MAAAARSERAPPVVAANGRLTQAAGEGRLGSSFSKQAHGVGPFGPTSPAPSASGRPDRLDAHLGRDPIAAEVSARCKPHRRSRKKPVPDLIRGGSRFPTKTCATKKLAA